MVSISELYFVFNVVGRFRQELSGIYDTLCVATWPFSLALYSNIFRIFLYGRETVADCKQSLQTWVSVILLQNMR